MVPPLYGKLSARWRHGRWWFNPWVHGFFTSYYDAGRPLFPPRQPVCIFQNAKLRLNNLTKESRVLQSFRPYMASCHIRSKLLGLCLSMAHSRVPVMLNVTLRCTTITVDAICVTFLHQLPAGAEEMSIARRPMELHRPTSQMWAI